MARGIKGHEWTAAEDAVIREMLEGGASVIDVCDRLGVDMVTMKNRLYALRKADPTFPRCMRTGRPSASELQTSDVPCERDAAAEGGSGDVPTGTLGELEAVRRERDALIEEKECYTEEFEDGVAYYKQQAAEAEKIVSAQVDEMEKVRCESRRLAAEVCEVNRIVVGLVAGYVLNHTKEVGG